MRSVAHLGTVPPAALSSAIWAMASSSVAGSASADLAAGLGSGAPSPGFGSPSPGLPSPSPSPGLPSPSPSFPSPADAAPPFPSASCTGLQLRISIRQAPNRPQADQPGSRAIPAAIASVQ